MLDSGAGFAYMGYVSSRVDTVIAIGKGMGSRSKEFQRLVRMNCERGWVLEMLEATAAVLLKENVPDPIPVAVGARPSPLDVKASVAIDAVVNAYSQDGGVLTAKGYCSEEELENELWRQWSASYPQPIPETVDLTRDLDENEINARLTVTAQAVLHELVTECGIPKGKVVQILNEPEGVALSLEASRLESFCMKAARAMLRAFQKPNDEISRRAQEDT